MYKIAKYLMLSTDYIPVVINVSVCLQVHPWLWMCIVAAFFYSLSRYYKAVQISVSTHRLK